MTTTSPDISRGLCATVPARRFARFSWVILVGLALLAFFPFIGRRDITTSHEARVAQTARQMAASGWPWNAVPVTVPAVEVERVNGIVRTVRRPGAKPWSVNPWLIPVMNDRIRLQKPPLPYWCVAVMDRLVGMGEGVARFPSALLGAVAVLIVFDLGKRLLGNLGGWCCALVWCSSYFVPSEFRKVMADPYLAFFALTAVWSWVRLSESRRTGWLIAFYASIALGGLAKGPVILLFVIVAVGAYQFCCRRPLPRSIYDHLAGVGLVLVLTVPWMAYVYRHIPNAVDVWRYESIGELTDNTEKARPWFYYLPAIFQIALPWTPVLVVGWIDAAIGSGKRDRRAQFALAWYVIIVLFFSILNVKKNAYLLPLMAAQTLLIAQGLLLLFRAVRKFGEMGPYSILLFVQRVMGAVFAVVAVALCFRFGTESIVAMSTAAGLAMVCLLAANKPAKLRRQRFWLLAVSVAYVLLLGTYFEFFVTPDANLRSRQARLRRTRTDAQPAGYHPPHPGPPRRSVALSAAGRVARCAGFARADDRR